MKDVAGKVVAITGGARGIGEAAARALAGAGAKVAIGDLDGDLAQSAAAMFSGIGLPLDVSSRESFTRFLDQVEAEYGRIDVLVNNAGIMVIGRMHEAPLEAQLKQIDVNLRGVIHGCYEAAPRMFARGGGLIINVASMAGMIPTPGSAVYSATKSGVVTLGDALDAEFVDHGVRVATILPTFTSTALIDGTTPPKANPPVTPEQVADAIVGVVRKYKPLSVVPRSMGIAVIQWPLLPQGARRWIAKRTGTDQMFTNFDHAARAEYETRTTGQAY